MTTASDGGSDDLAAPVSVTVPDPAPEPVAAPAEPGFVVVSRDEVEEYAGKGYTPGYAMLKPE